MKHPVYPFSAIVSQQEMKLALLLAAVDWRIGVLLRGDKGSGKTTAARALAALLPQPSPFIDLPIGTTEDRLLGGLHLERALQGEPVLKPGLLSEAHGGVLYVDEINLLPAHLGDALLDAASSGVNVVEREGLSASHAAEFVLLGSMNPEEGALRPQLLDRFALALDVAAPLDPATRQTVVERRIAFEHNRARFGAEWSGSEQQLREQVNSARTRHAGIVCTSEIFGQISECVCEAGVRSLRADLAIVRAAIAYAALLGDASVSGDHVAVVLPLALAHRRQDRARTPPSHSPPPAGKLPEKSSPSDRQGGPALDRTQPTSADSSLRTFAPDAVETFALLPAFADAGKRGATTALANPPGCVVRSRRTDTPAELDVRASIHSAMLETGTLRPRRSDLHERVREPQAGTRYLLVIDSSGSHAVQERMRLVKGVATALLERSFTRGDEVVIIVFRGATAQVLLEPTSVLRDATSALEYLPTGGRTPLAHALELAQAYLTPATVLILLTDGRTNVPLDSGDAWQDALAIAYRMKASGLVIDTEISTERLGRALALAEALGVGYFHLESSELHENTIFPLTHHANRFARPVPGEHDAKL